MKMLSRHIKGKFVIEVDFENYKNIVQAYTAQIPITLGSETTWRITNYVGLISEDGSKVTMDIDAILVEGEL